MTSENIKTKDVIVGGGVIALLLYLMKKVKGESEGKLGEIVSFEVKR